MTADVEWTSYSDEGVAVELPGVLRRSLAKRLNSSPSGRFFKGRLRRGDATSELVVVLDLNLDRGMARSWIRETPESAGAVFEHPDGAEACCHYSGPSLVRPGGVEVRNTTRNPPPHGEAHRWTAVLPNETKWIYVDVISASGPMGWEEFQALGERIIRSVRVFGQK